MKRLFIKFILPISLVMGMLMAPGVLKSCGPMLGPNESRFSLFRPGMDYNSGLRPFNYSELPFNSTEADPLKLDYKRNCAEWVAFCGNSVKANDIYNIQYEVRADSFLLSYNNRKLDEFKSNTFIQWLLKKENQIAIEYMILAKEAESTQFNNNTDDPWDTSAVKTGFQCETIAEKASQALLSPLPVFLKERYAFQAVKMYYYSAEEKNYNKKLHKLYEDYLLQSNSIVAGWALVYYGMSQYNTNLRTTFLLQAFDKTEEKKEYCYSKISTADLEALEKTTSDSNLLVLINTFKAIKNKGRALDQIKRVFQYDPGSKYLPLLITREINKLENWIWSPEMLYFSDNYRSELTGGEDVNVTSAEKLKEKDKQYLDEVKVFIEGITGKNKNHTLFTQLSLTHIYNMQHDFAGAQKMLQRIGVVSNPFKEIQRLIEQVITTAQLMDISKFETQQVLATCIRKLTVLSPVFKKQMDKAKYNIWENAGRSESDDDLSELYILLSHCFEKKGDMVTAGLLYSSANVTVNNYDGWAGDDKESYKDIAYFDRYASPKDIDSLLAFKHKKFKTSFEELISPKKWISDDHYKDLQGTILFRQKKYREALSVFESMKPDFWLLHYEYKYYLPLTSVTHTGKMVPSEESVPAKYSRPGKMLIVKDIVNLIDAIPAAKNNAEKALLCYKLANAYFNTSYNGKAWMVFSYGKSSVENYNRQPGGYNWASFDFYPNGLKYADYYYRCSDAITMYKKALSLTTNKEFAAKCLLSLSVCDIIRHNNIKNGNGERWTENEQAYVPDYLRQLKAAYGSTNAFKEAGVECPDVKRLITKM